MALTPEQLRRYRSAGYALGGRILDAAALERLRREIDRKIAALPAGRRPENMPSVHYDDPYFLDLFLSPPLVEVARQILGPDVALFVSYIISKQPGDGLAVRWHQDGAFFPIEPMETFTLWLAVDDSDRDNGCMQVVPGSHRPGVLLPHQVDLHSGTTLPLSLDGIDLSGAADVEVRAGGCSVHDPFLLHGSAPNRSSRRRCGITIKYIPTHVRIDRSFVSPTGFDWGGVKLFLASGDPGTANRYENA
jgi:ectoine hydroxylase-related dioxygenase (phytanoyl-CoA dioxygenase family)